VSQKKCVRSHWSDGGGSAALDSERRLKKMIADISWNSGGDFNCGREECLPNNSTKTVWPSDAASSLHFILGGVRNTAN